MTVSALLILWDRLNVAFSYKEQCKSPKLDIIALLRTAAIDNAISSTTIEEAHTVIRRALNNVEH